MEAVVLEYYTDWERRKPKYLGAGQLALIHGFAEPRRSPALRQRLGELQRKFHRLDDDPPRGISSGLVGPPFNAIWEHLKDKDWLRAISRYEKDEHSPRDFLRGGAYELGGVLKTQTSKDPARFAQLIHRFPDKANPTYFSHVLYGLAEANAIDPELIWDTLRRCHRLPSRPCGRAMENVVRAYAGQDLPEDILALVAWYATESPNPERERWREVASGDGDPEHAGLNSVRGGMASGIATLLFAHPGYYTFFAPYLELMVCDPSIAVRTQVAYALLPVINVDRDRAVELFLRLCDDSDDALLRGRFIYEFLRYTCHTHLDRVMALIERMLASSDEITAHHGALLVCIAALYNSVAEPLADTCLTGSELMRRAAAEVAAANLLIAPNRQRCKDVLLQLFNDESHGVQQAAAHCFADLKRETLAELQELIAPFIQSRAFGSHSIWFFDALKESTVQLPDVVLQAFERHAGSAGAPLWLDREASNILLRLYERSPSPEVKKRCLDIFDQLARRNINDLQRLLADDERSC